MLYELVQENGPFPDRVVVTFDNTGREMNETLDFVQECGDRWVTPITWLELAPRRAITAKELEMVAQHLGATMAARLEAWWEVTETGFRIVSHNSAARHGEPFVALILQRKFLPNQAARFCTTELKVRTSKRYLMSLGWQYWTNCVGLRADEPARLKPEGEKLKGDRWSVWQPLANAEVTKRHVSSFWKQQPFDLRLPNVNGKCWLGNCDGCFLKAEVNLAALSRDYSTRAGWWEGMESLATELTTGTAAQWSKRYTRAELRDFMERQGDWALSTEGVLCQADHGECFG
jgi:3'-phosphoadenosine 5'-phosphosulfate sulfotransferase (PAPS reductase)/FAD synthetase